MFEEIINNMIVKVNTSVLTYDELNLPLISKILEIDTYIFLQYFVERYNTSEKPKKNKY